MRQIMCLALVLLCTAGCATNPTAPTSIAGEWHGQSDNARGTILNFEPGGRLQWTINAGGTPSTVEAKYETRNEAASPVTLLDVTNFSAGPLQGSSLYCIYELTSPDALRIDCERGSLTNASVRPAAFDEKQTQLFTRKR